jgi:uncharacterized protein YutE (UPF0331/DUF86 family)
MESSRWKTTGGGGLTSWLTSQVATKTYASFGAQPSRPWLKGFAMVERDVVLAKVATIDRCLNRIAEVQRPRSGALTSVDVEDIMVLNLTRAAQATIDLATHVVTTEAYGLPDSVGAAFGLLAKQGVIADSLADRMRKMVGFRNVAVHDYQTLNPDVLHSIVEHHLEDLRAFARAIIERFKVA